MIVLPCNQTVFCDVDDTLVLWNPTEEQRNKYGEVEIVCPGSFAIVDGEMISSPSFTETLVPYLPHIEQLKKHKARGHTVVVWSAGGYDWAKVAVEALGLTQYVDLVISKPTWAYDDLPPNEYMPKSQYIKD